MLLPLPLLSLSLVVVVRGAAVAVAAMTLFNELGVFAVFGSVRSGPWTSSSSTERSGLLHVAFSEGLLVAALLGNRKQM